MASRLTDNDIIQEIKRRREIREKAAQYPYGQTPRNEAAIEVLAVIEKAIKTLHMIECCEADQTENLGKIGLSERAKNALIRAGIYSSEVLVKMDEEQLRQRNNVGAKIAKEVFEKIKTIQYVAKPNDRADIKPPELPSFPESMLTDKTPGIAGKTRPDAVPPPKPKPAPAPAPVPPAAPQPVPVKAPPDNTGGYSSATGGPTDALHNVRGGTGGYQAEPRPRQ